MKYSESASLRLLNHLSTPLLIVDRTLQILWSNTTLQKRTSFFQVGANLQELFVGQQSELEKLLSQNHPLNTLDDELNEHNHVVLALPNQYTCFEIVAQPMKDFDLFLLEVRALSSGCELTIDEVKVQLEQCEQRLRDMNTRHTDRLFNIFNSLFLIKNETSKTLDITAKYCYELYAALLNNKEIGTGKDPLYSYSFQTVAIQHHLNELVAEVRTLSNYPAGKLIFTATDFDLLVKLDVERFNMALYNVLSNAYQASYGDGIIEVRLSTTQDRALCVIAIKDHGCGIAKQELENVFTLGQLRKKQATSTEGIDLMALGLPATKQIIDNHGGNIAIESQEGLGTTVLITLPLLDPKELSTPVVKTPRKSLVSKLSPICIFLSDSCKFDAF